MHMARNHSSGKFFKLEKLWPLEVRRGKGNYLTIIFIHGLQILNRTDAWRSTWIKRGTDVCWPEAWLPEDLGKEKVRVLSVSYDASQWGKREPASPVQDFGSKFVEELIHRYSINSTCTFTLLSCTWSLTIWSYGFSHSHKSVIVSYKSRIAADSYHRVHKFLWLQVGTSHQIRIWRGALFVSFSIS